MSMMLLAAFKHMKDDVCICIFVVSETLWITIWDAVIKINKTLQHFTNTKNLPIKQQFKNAFSTHILIIINLYNRLHKISQEFVTIHTKEIIFMLYTTTYACIYLFITFFFLFFTAVSRFFFCKSEGSF